MGLLNFTTCSLLTIFLGFILFQNASGDYYCPFLEIPMNGVKSNTKYNLRDKVHFHCRGGHILLGSNVRECLSNRTWSGTEAKCIGQHEFDSDTVIRDRLMTIIARIQEEKRKELEGYRVRVLLYFVFDGTPGVGAPNFAKSIEFAKVVVKKVGISEHGVRAGALTYRTRTRQNFYPLNYHTTEDVLRALDTIEYLGLDINPGRSITSIWRSERTSLVDAFSGYAKSFVFILTAGKENVGGIPVDAAKQIKGFGVEIHCIGVTGNMNRRFLYDIASESKNNIGEEYPNVYAMQSYNSLDWIVQEITKGVVANFEIGCEVPKIVNGEYGRYIDFEFKKVDKTVLENKQMLTLRCHDGYAPFPRQSKDSNEGVFEEKITCENGTWSKNFSCLEKSITCPVFESPQGIEVTYTLDLSVGSHAIFKCSATNILQGNTYAVCLSNGTWSHSLPSCKDDTCTDFYSLERRSPLIRTMCEGGVCECAKGGCPLKDPFYQFLYMSPDDRVEKLKTFFCENFDYVWKGSLSGRIRQFSDFLSISFNVHEVIKAGTEEAGDIEGQTRTLLAPDNCNTANLIFGATYLILAKDGEAYKNKNGDIWHRYILDQTSAVYKWTGVNLSQNPQFQNDLTHATEDLKSHGCSSSERGIFGRFS